MQINTEIIPFTFITRFIFIWDQDKKEVRIKGHKVMNPTYNILFPT